MANHDIQSYCGRVIAEILRNRLKNAHKHYLDFFNIDEDSDKFLFFSLAMYASTCDVMNKFSLELGELLWAATNGPIELCEMFNRLYAPGDPKKDAD